MKLNTIRKASHEKIDTAVSETVGYVIIFGIMMSGIALVTLFGYPALLSQQQEANIRNMERNMIVLQSDVNALAYKSVPYRETTMQVSGGVLSVEDPAATADNPEPPYFEIKDGTDNSLLTGLRDRRFYPGAIQFLSDSGDVAVALQNGAVVKWQVGETGQQYKPSVMLSKPRWFIDDYDNKKTFVITLIQAYPADVLSKSGICTIQMRVESLKIHDPDGNPNSGDETNFYDRDPPGKTVKVSIGMNPRYLRAWANYLENDLKMVFVPSSDPPTWQRTDIDRLVIKGYNVTVLNI